MLIIHRCKKCGHPDYWQRGSVIAGGMVNGHLAVDKFENPLRRCHDEGWGPSETAPRWRNSDFHLITEPAVPGKLADTITPCGCDECKALYQQLTNK